MSRSAEGTRFGYSERKRAEGRRTVPGRKCPLWALGGGRTAGDALMAEWRVPVLRRTRAGPLSLPSWRVLGN